MARNFVQSCGWLIVLGLALQPAQAGDRKSAKRIQEEAPEIVVAQKAHAVSLRYEMRGAPAAKPFGTGSSTSSDRGSDRDQEKAASSPRRLTFFHFHSKFGDVAVQPVIGQVNGAQFSLGF